MRTFHLIAALALVVGKANGAESFDPLCGGDLTWDDDGPGFTDEQGNLFTCGEVGSYADSMGALHADSCGWPQLSGASAEPDADQTNVWLVIDASGCCGTDGYSKCYDFLPFCADPNMSCHFFPQSCYECLDEGSGSGSGSSSGNSVPSEECMTGCGKDCYGSMDFSHKWNKEQCVCLVTDCYDSRDCNDDDVEFLEEFVGDGCGAGDSSYDYSYDYSDVEGIAEDKMDEDGAGRAFGLAVVVLLAV